MDSSSAEPWQMVGDCACQEGQSCGVVAPEVQLAADAFSCGSPASACVDGRAPSSPPALCRDGKLGPRAQPVEVPAAACASEVEGVVEEGGVAAPRPAAFPGRRVVVAGEAERERERRRGSAMFTAWKAPRLTPNVTRSCGPPQSSWIRHDLLEDPRLVALVRAGALLDRDRAVRPTTTRRRVDAVELRGSASIRPESAPTTPRSPAARRCRARREARNGRPQWPWTTTLPAAPIAGEYSSAWRPPPGSQQVGQVGVQRVAPGRVVVQVRDLALLSPSAAAISRLVLEVLLAGALGQLGRRRAAAAAAQHLCATNAVPRTQPGERAPGCRARA